jgi:hypothetical protein
MSHSMSAAALPACGRRKQPEHTPNMLYSAPVNAAAASELTVAFILCVCRPSSGAAARGAA